MFALTLAWKNPINILCTYISPIKKRVRKNTYTEIINCIVSSNYDDQVNCKIEKM